MCSSAYHIRALEVRLVRPIARISIRCAHSRYGSLSSAPFPESAKYRDPMRREQCISYDSQFPAGGLAQGVAHVTSIIQQQVLSGRKRPVPFTGFREKTAPKPPHSRPNTVANGNFLSMPIRLQHCSNTGWFVRLDRKDDTRAHVRMTYLTTKR